ncbi:MAG: hypothetical protein ACRDTA_24720 [Pseudonocardiaceae bacterium]
MTHVDGGIGSRIGAFGLPSGHCSRPSHRQRRVGQRFPIGSRMG